MIFDSEAFRFAIVCVAGTVFAAIGGIDLGAGTLLRFFKSDEEHARIISVGCSRIWRKFEIWLALAVGAIFTAFPRECSDFFREVLPLLIVFLVALLFRFVVFFVRKIFAGTERTKRICDAIFFGTSVGIAFLLGAVAGSLVVAPSLHDNDTTLAFLDLIDPVVLSSGVLAVAVFALHAAIFLRPKTAELVRFKIEMLLPRLFAFAAIFCIATFAFALFNVPNIARESAENPVLGAVPVAAIFSLVAAGFFLRCRTFKLAFVGTSATLAFLVLTALLRA